MKVAVVHNFFRTSRGGAERAVHQLVRHMQEEGHDVRVFALKGVDGTGPQESLPEGSIAVRPWNIYHAARAGEQPLAARLIWWALMVCNVPIAFRLFRMLRGWKPDVVWTHNLFGLSFLIPPLLRAWQRKGGSGAEASVAGIRVRQGTWVHTAHDIQLAYPTGVKMQGHYDGLIWEYARRAYEALCRLLWGSPRIVVFPSQWIQRFYADRSFFVRSRTHISASAPPPILSRIRQKGGALALLYVGQLEEHKGVRFLLHALESCPFPFDWRLDIAGEGSLAPEVQEAAARNPRVRYHGFVGRGQLEELYQKADTVVVPSLTLENAPVVIQEAYAEGVPVIASRIGGIPEQVREGISGWLFSPGDSADMCAKIQECFRQVRGGGRETGKG